MLSKQQYDEIMTRSKQRPDFYQKVQEKLNTDSQFRADFAMYYDPDGSKGFLANTPQQEQPRRGLGARLSDIPQDISKTVSNIRGNIQTGIDKASEAQEKVISGEQSLGSGTLQTIGAGLQAGARAVGDVALGALSLITTPKEEEMIQNALSSSIGRIAEKEEVQNLIQQYSNWRESNPEQAGNLESVGGIAEAVLAVAGLNPAQKGVQTAIKTGREATESAVQNISKSVSDITKASPVVEKTAEQISKEVFDTAVSRGFSQPQAGTFSRLTPKEIPIARQMLENAEQVAQGKVPRNTRTIDLIGNEGTKFYKALEKELEKAGTKVGEVADTLKGQKVNPAPLRDKMIKTLNEKGIDIEFTKTGKPKSINFSSTSPFADLTEVHQTLKKAITRAFNSTSDASILHNSKKQLDALIGGGKVGTGLVGDSKRIVQSLRKDIDDFLDNTFTDYKNANQAYTDIIKPFNEIIDQVKLPEDSNFSQMFRRVFSNSPNRSSIEKVIDTMQETAKKLGIEPPANIQELTLFAEILEDMFGTEAITGLKGTIEKGVSGARKILSGDVVGGAGAFFGEGIDFIAGQRPQDRIDFLKNLLKEKQ